VHLLDQLVRQVPEGVYLRSIVQRGLRVKLLATRNRTRASRLSCAISRLALAGAARAGRGQANSVDNGASRTSTEPLAQAHRIEAKTRQGALKDAAKKG